MTKINPLDYTYTTCEIVLGGITIPSNIKLTITQIGNNRYKVFVSKALPAQIFLKSSEVSQFTWSSPGLTLG